MSNGQPKQNKRSSLQKRKFYRMDFYRTGNPCDFQITNDPQSLEPGHLSDFAGPTPRVTFNPRRRRPRDCELWYSFWLISDRAKIVFEAVDPEAFSFVVCDVHVPNGVWDGPRYWFCDVRRSLDALDEERSRLTIGICDDPIYRDFGQKYYDFFGDVELVFKDELVGDAHAFRMAYARQCVIFDQAMKNAWKAAGLRGMLFEEVSYLPLIASRRV
ncbi:hypothetical protein XH83_25800 [Bradyrhizobium sp. CCBAU 53351]|uniref:imm11 family protein n=1 Tax=Bradyrhizobium sp. CCBAU 53351 TaxID=1325114 RepID=UPI0018886A27|nr:DUF1629 domain-containing protein [Bradyrhizobium sp. CCBAU 53351]QOZ78534.1 hypothetical protein XH83_25800 [Bradyrhizobium sp. CCBAU 53351]